MALGEASWAELKAELRGELILAGDTRYEQARRVWNGMIDRRPAAIVRCAGAADVINAIRFARSEGLPLAIRGGGHNVAGNAVCDDGLVIDFAVMRSLRVDPAHRTARADPGLTWGEFDREAQAFGLATTGGLISTTGIAGFTLGGGIGWLMRQYGLTCDNLLGVDLVTAEGRLVHASSDENPDLFWGVRGGGSNFGVVTSLQYRLQPVGALYAGMVLHPLHKGDSLLRFYRDYARDLPDALTTFVILLTVPPAPFIPEHLHGTQAVAVVAAHCGAVEDAEVAVRPLRRFGPPAFEHFAPMPYTALQSMFDPSAPAGMHNYWKSAYLGEITDDVIGALLAHAATMPRPWTAVHIHQLGGAVARAGEEGGAYAHRSAAFALNLVTMWADPCETEANIRWTRDVFDAIEPFAQGVYVNFLGEEGEERVRTAYGHQYARLAALKAKYDPTNFFRVNQNIRPAALTTGSD